MTPRGVGFRALALGVAAALGLALATPARACELPANAATMMAGAGSAVNEARGGAGRKALRRSAQLDQAAQRHACWMAVNNVFSHEGRGGSRPSDRIRATGYNAKLSSENIASGQASASQVVSEWMSSKGHKTNILRSGLDDYGVGVALMSGRPVWVMLFAARR